MPQKSDIIAQLQAEISRMEGFKPASSASRDTALGPVSEAFPSGSFPVGAIHEFMPARKDDATATTAFVAGLVASLMGTCGAALWISSSTKVFPPGLKYYGIEPDRVIFIDLKNERDVKPAMEEALKCSALSAVIGEMQSLDFTTSRRLQLAVEQSRVTGFVLRNDHSLNATACVSRWKIASMESERVGTLPGVGFPRWKVELLRVRGGKPGAWEIKWMHGKFMYASQPAPSIQEQKRKVG